MRKQRRPKPGDNHISLRWQPPFRLQRGGDEGYLYSIDLASIPDGPGIYVFGRLRGTQVKPVYIGVATRSVRKRIKQQLNNLRMMTAVGNARGGRRVLVVAELVESRARVRRVLPALELAMIRHALAEGHAIVNKSGTKIRAYALRHLGNKVSRSWMPRWMEADKIRRPRRKRTT